MKRFAKTYSQPSQPDRVGPHSNKFTIDLMGLPIGDEHMEMIRSEAVKAAMIAAAGLMKEKDIFSDFGTFSTFSTFSTFGSGAATLPQIELPASIDPGAARVIAGALGGKTRPKG